MQVIAFTQQLLLTRSGQFILPLAELPEPDFLLPLWQGNAELQLAVYRQWPAMPGIQLWADADIRQLKQTDLAVFGRARSLYAWYLQHQFCGLCGGATQPWHQGGEVYASCGQCGARHYPRINPCVITVITRPGELLLARGHRHPPGMYAAIAGFIDAGESAEQALVREVQEEVGLTVTAQHYLGSESWPFPQQLMLAFEAQCQPGPLRLAAGEILAADWFAYDQLPNIPPVQTIAGRMIRQIAARMAAQA